MINNHHEARRPNHHHVLDVECSIRIKRAVEDDTLPR